MPFMHTHVLQLKYKPSLVRHDAGWKAWVASAYRSNMLHIGPDDFLGETDARSLQKHAKTLDSYLSTPYISLNIQAASYSSQYNELLKGKLGERFPIPSAFELGSQEQTQPRAVAPFPFALRRTTKLVMCPLLTFCAWLLHRSWKRGLPGGRMGMKRRSHAI